MKTTLAVLALIVGTFLTVGSVAPASGKAEKRKNTDTIVLPSVGGIAVNNAKFIFLIDYSASQIVKIDPKGGVIARWGKKGRGKGEFTYLSSIALDQRGDCYALESWPSRIQKLDPAGRYLTKWTIPKPASGKPGVLCGISVGKDGTVYAGNSHRAVSTRSMVPGITCGRGALQRTPCC